MPQNKSAKGFIAAASGFKKGLVIDGKIININNKASVAIVKEKPHPWVNASSNIDFCFDFLAI